MAHGIGQVGPAVGRFQQRYVHKCYLWKPDQGKQQEVPYLSRGANLTTAVTIQTGKPAGAATITFTADAAAATAGDLLKAFNDALVANPGGIVSTVTGPVTVAQVLDSTDGRQLITTAQVNALFTGVAIA